MDRSVLVASQSLTDLLQAFYTTVTPIDGTNFNVSTLLLEHEMRYVEFTCIVGLSISTCHSRSISATIIVFGPLQVKAVHHDSYVRL